jgi:hypothetical protein
MTMKKMILLSMILPSLSFCQLIFSNQIIEVSAENLSIESVEYTDAEVVTSTVSEWITTNVVYQGGPLENYATATNTVQQQVLTEVVTTNAATWTCNVIFELPKGHHWELSGFPVSVQRFKVSLRVPVDPSVVTATFGPAAAGLEFAASNGAYQPTGQVKNAFLSFAATVLAGGNQ